MADQNNINNQFDERSITNQTREFINATRQANAEIYGTDLKNHEEHQRDIADITSMIQSISKKYSKVIGSDPIEMFTAFNADTANVRSKSGLKEISKKFQEKIENQQLAGIGDLFVDERNRFQDYESYRLIVENIPQMAQALQTFVDNIISPDDFTKNSFNIYFKGEPINSFEKSDNYNRILKNIKELIKNYKLNIKCEKIIYEALQFGDCFVMCPPIKKELEKMLDGGIKTEDILADNVVKNDLLAENVTITNEEFDELCGEKLTKQDKTKIYQEVANVLNNNLIISADSFALYQENLDYMHDFTNFQSKADEHMFNSIFNKTDDKKKHDTTEQLKISGSVVKILDPTKVVKLVLDDVCYGYYYVEGITAPADVLTSGSYSLNTNIFTNFKTQQSDDPTIMNGKYRLITELFIRNISKKLNKKFINKHTEFKDLIYNLVKQDYLLNKQIRITYLRPDEVVHFGQQHEKADYYESIFKNILFSAKLYLAVLTSQVMLKLVRSPEKRVFYIEVDLDNDTESTVQSFIRDIKTKDIRMSNFSQDINTILNAVGSFTDYYIPVVNGSKPVDIDTLQGMNVEMNNDFLEYLLKTMMSGLGIPPEFLSYSDQTEFARSLGMMNGKFVRTIIVIQRIFEEQFTTLLRTLYKNEYLDQNYKDTSITKSNIEVNLEDIECRFAAPQALNMTTTNEQINGSRELIEYVANTLISEEDVKTQFKFKQLMSKSLLVNLDWETYEDMVKEAQLSSLEDDLQKPAEGENQQMDNF